MYACRSESGRTWKYIVHICLPACVIAPQNTHIYTYNTYTQHTHMYTHARTETHTQKNTPVQSRAEGPIAALVSAAVGRVNQ